MNTTSRGFLQSVKSCTARRYFWRSAISTTKFTPPPPPTTTTTTTLACHIERVGRRRFSSSDGNFGILPLEEMSDRANNNNDNDNDNNNYPAVIATGDQLLDKAAAEGRRIVDFCQKRNINHNKNILVFQENLQILENQVDRLLTATIASVPLSKQIAISRNEGRVHSLHRAFLTIVQTCVTVLMQTVVMDSDQSTKAIFLSSEPPLLKKTLQLVTRAREDLHLPFPLPLYQWLAVSIAQTANSSSTITQWIVQAAKWARDDFGSHSITQKNQEFLAQPLCHLAQRKRFTEMADILLLVLETEHFSIHFLSDNSLKEILGALDDDLQTHLWNVSRKDSISPQAEVLMEILLLLEPSIWKILGHTPVVPDRMDSLKEAVEVLLRRKKEEEDDQEKEDSLSLSLYADSPELIQALFPERFPKDFTSPDDDYYNYNDEEMDDDEDDEDDDDNEDEDDDVDATYNGPKGTWEIQLDLDSNRVIVGMRPISKDDEDYDSDDDDDDDDASSQDTQWNTQMLYTRSMLPGTLPDVVHQIEEVIGQPLQYSKPLEKELIREMHQYDF